MKAKKKRERNIWDMIYIWDKFWINDYIGSISGFDIYPFISLSISSPNIACTSTKFSNMANKTFSNQMILGGKSSSSSSSTSASPKNVL